MKPDSFPLQQVKWIVLTATLVCLVLLAVQSWNYSERYGGTDLRHRVVASRLLATSHSLYFYKSRPEDGDYYFDPNDKPEFLVNGTSVTPAVLYVTYPI